MKEHDIKFSCREVEHWLTIHGHRDWVTILFDISTCLHMSPLVVKEWQTQQEWSLAVAEAMQLAHEGLKGMKMPYMENAVAHYSNLSRKAKESMESIETSLVMISARSSRLSEMTDDFLFEFQEAQCKFNDIYSHCEKVMQVYYMLLNFWQRIQMPMEAERWEDQRRARNFMRSMGFDERSDVQATLSRNTSFDLKEETFYASEYPEFFVETQWYKDRGKRLTKKFNI